MEGIIALDIDGTLTASNHEIPAPVVSYLSQLAENQWTILLITGRSFSTCFPILDSLYFPYNLYVQNGAMLLHMPDKKILSKKYLDISIFDIMEEICEGEPTDFVLFAGADQQDLCYYRSMQFEPWLLENLRKRAEILSETWIDLASFQHLPIQEFASLKCFGYESSLTRIAASIESRLGLHVPLIRDPFADKGHFIAQATHPAVSKGEALRDFIKLQPKRCPVIAAGDDLNDLSMMEVADYKIVMETAPPSLLKLADVVAPPAAELGIIKGIATLLKRLQG